MAVEQLKVEVAERSGSLENCVPLVSISAPCHNSGKVIAGMIGGITKVTANDHGGVIEQRSPIFLDPVEFREEFVEVLYDVDLDPAQFRKHAGLTPVVR